MWRWHQSGRNRLWTHVIASCTFVHCMMLCMLFLVYRGSVDNYLVFTSSALSTQQVILLPLRKIVGNQSAVSPTPVQPPRASQIDTQGDVVERERQVPAHQETQATTLASSFKTSKKKQIKKTKKKSGKKSKKTTSKKKREKLKEKAKKTQEAKKETKKKIEEKPKPVVDQTPKPVVPAVAATGETPVAMSVPADAQSAIYVGQLEYEALQLQEAINRELQTYWKPPVGHAGATCTLRAVVDWQGQLADIIVEQSSGMLMFDMSAEQAISAMTFPKTAWGKQVTITFN